MTERAAPRAVRWCEPHTARRTPRRGVLIHWLRVLVGVVPHDRQLPPALPRATSSHRRRHSQPQTTRSFRPPGSFSSLLSLVRTFRSTLAALHPALTPVCHPPYIPATPFVARMSTMPLAAIYPNRANAQPPWLSSDRPPRCYTAHPAVPSTRHPLLSRAHPRCTDVTPSVLAVNVRRVTTLGS